MTGMNRNQHDHLLGMIERMQRERNAGGRDPRGGAAGRQGGSPGAAPGVARDVLSLFRRRPSRA